jgi:hypothetical protein
MTPSGWGDDAQGRDAGHDEMQAAVWRHLKKLPDHQVSLDKETNKFKRRSVDVEFPFVQDGRIIGFADVCEVFAEISDDSTKWTRGIYYIVYEIKPRILSVGAILRQCQAARQMVWSLHGGRHDPNFKKPYCSVVAVVPSDDKKFGLLLEMADFDVLPWGVGCHT